MNTKTNNVSCCNYRYGLILVFLSLLTGADAQAQPSSFTQEDRARLIRLETTVQLYMENTDKRFVELREDMNKRFEQVDKRFEQVDKRFEQMMAALQMIAAIFTTLTIAVIGFAYWDRRSVISKAREATLETLAQTAPQKEQELLDRAVAQSVQAMEQGGKLQNLIAASRKLSAADQPLAQVLREYHLL